MIVATSRRSWLIGTAGVVKTTALREMARLPFDAYKSVVVVVDTTSDHCWTNLCGATSWGREAHSEVFRNVGRAATIGRTSPRGYTRGNVLSKF